MASFGTDDKIGLGIMAANAVANWFGGSRGGNEQLEPYGSTALGAAAGLDAEASMAKALQNLETYGAILQEQAAQPISLPGAFYQPMPTYYGGGMPFAMGPSAIDPALVRPGAHLTRPGVNFPEPSIKGPAQYKDAGGTLHDVKGDMGEPVDFYGPKSPFAHMPNVAGSSWAETGPREANSGLNQLKFRQGGQEVAGDAFPRATFDPQPREVLFPGASRRVQPHQMEGFGGYDDPKFLDYASRPTTGYLEGGFRGAEQPGPAPLAVGGGLQELQDSLTMLGVETDPFGNMVMGRDYPFRGSPFQATPSPATSAWPERQHRGPGTAIMDWMEPGGVPDYTADPSFDPQVPAAQDMQTASLFGPTLNPGLNLDVRRRNNANATS
jgi:hypothetical protein